MVSVVNIIVLGRTAETKRFERQARDIKVLIKEFQPREVVIDINGLGIGLGDLMIQEQYDIEHGVLPAYGFKNDDNYKKVQPKNAPQILYGIKANGPLNSKIHSNCYSFINSGKIHFLIHEKEAKSKLLATKTGASMSNEKKIKRLMPHEMTTSLFEEMLNLRLKKTGVNEDIVLERINPRFPKDKYSSFSYGLWRVKEIEEEEQKKHRRRGLGPRKLVFYTGA